MHLTSWEAVHQPTRDNSGTQIFLRMGERIHNNRDPMPPSGWFNAGGAPKPTADEIKTLDDWIAQGAPAGNGCAPPPPPPGQGGNSGFGGAGNVPNVGGS